MRNVISFIVSHYDIFYVMMLGLLTTIVATKTGSKVSAYIAVLVGTAEQLFEKHENDKKLLDVMDKFENRFPMVSMIIGKRWTVRLIEKALKTLQEMIGTTTVRQEKQKEALDYLNERTITRTKEITARTLSQAIQDRDFFTDTNLASNDQVIEETEKILSEKKIEDIVVPNLDKIKKSLLGFKFTGKF